MPSIEPESVRMHTRSRLITATSSRVKFGSGSSIKGDVDKLLDEEQVEFFLFGDDKNTGGSILVTRGKRKGRAARMLSKKKNEIIELDPEIVEEVKGGKDWALVADPMPPLPGFLSYRADREGVRITPGRKPLDPPKGWPKYRGYGY